TQQFGFLDYPLGTGILPTALDQNFTDTTLATVNPLALHSPTLLHANDPEPARIYSLDGSIIDGDTESGDSVGFQLRLVFDKPAQLQAAQNIQSLMFYG